MTLRMEAVIGQGIRKTILHKYGGSRLFRPQA